jgi:hypothetical protein
MSRGSAMVIGGGSLLAPEALTDGRPDAYLSARGDGSRSTARFNWDDGAWTRAAHVEFDG